MAESGSKPRHIARNAAKLLLGTLASRILGFVRDMLAVRYFGGRAEMDAFNVAKMIPDMFRGVLAEQAVESSFLPTFRSLLTQGKVQSAWRTASVILNRLFVMLAIAVVLSAVFAPFLTSDVFAPGFSAERAAEAARLGRVLAPFLLFIGLVAFFGSLLLAHRQFWAYGLAPTLCNVGTITCTVLLWRPLGLYALAVGYLVGVVLELAGSYLPIPWGRRRGFVQGRCRPSEGFSDPGADEVMRLAGPVCIAALIARCDYIVARVAASYLVEEGSVTAITLALQVVLVPNALFALSIGRAALVPLTEHAANGDTAAFQHGLGDAVRLGIMLLVPLSAGTALLAHPLAALYQGGRFGPSETDMLARAIRLYALGLAGMGLVTILSRALYAFKDTKAVLKASYRALMVNVLLTPLLALTPLQHAGIALAASIALTFQTVLLFVALRGKLREQGTLEHGLWFGKHLYVTIAATVVMAGAVLLARPAVENAVASVSLWARCVRLMLPALAGAIAFVATMFILDRRMVLRILSGGHTRA